MENNTFEYYQPLCDHMENEYGLILLVSELDEIIRLSQLVVNNYNKSVEDS